MDKILANKIELYYMQLMKKVSCYIELDADDIELIKSVFQYELIPKDVPIIETGKIADKSYFIISGYLKYYKLLDTGEELIIHLYAPYNYATSLNSFFLQKKSKEVLEAITECELFSISKSDLEKLYSSGEKWQIFGRKLMESFLIEKEERIIEQISLTAQERYMKLLNSQPEIIQNVPVKQIASFIGIKPESLSRIRKQIY